MKEETKELVEFIKDCVFRYQTELKRGEVDVGIIDGEEEDKTCGKAISFLDSLPEIESHLCRGGYIQDKNGTPCCHGDLIRIIVTGRTSIIGRLCWSDTDKNFSVRNAQKRQIAYFVHNLVFEKVHEVQSYKDIE